MKLDTKIVRISKISKIEYFKVFCKFNNGEYRYIDFEHLFKEWTI